MLGRAGTGFNEKFTRDATSAVEISYITSIAV